MKTDGRLDSTCHIGDNIRADELVGYISSWIVFICSIGYSKFKNRSERKDSGTEEIEFRCGDMDDLLAENLPDALALLQYLTEPPAEAQAEQ
jgi:hypothetical protein